MARKKGNDPRYTPSTTFETFPFPAGLMPNVRATSYASDPRATAVAEAARRIVELPLTVMTAGTIRLRRECRAVTPDEWVSTPQLRG